MPIYTFADLNMSVDCPLWMLDEKMEKFHCDDATADIQCSVEYRDANLTEFISAKSIIDNGIKTVSVNENSIRIAENDETESSLIVTSLDWSEVTIYLQPAGNVNYDAYYVASIQYKFSYLLRSVFSSALTLRNGVLIHAASIKWNGQGVLFSAPSGTGKTTHVNMWRERYGVEVLDGDVTACRMVQGKPYVYGLPWCGSSEQFLNDCVPLGALVFLEQSEDNSITRLALSDAVIRLYARCYLYVWDEKTADTVLEMITSALTGTDCYLLKCRPDFEAVELVKRCLEK